jgi:hypothetical protein
VVGHCRQVGIEGGSKGGPWIGTATPVTSLRHPPR